MATSSQWRYCILCHGLFSDEPAAKATSVCPGAQGRDRSHVRKGFRFVLDYRVAESDRAQRRWRRCIDCNGLFYSGHKGNQGTCPAGGAHRAHALSPLFARDYVLRHGRHETGEVQTRWRNCWRCQGLYYDGYEDKGACPAGGAHDGHGAEAGVWSFGLAHPISPRITAFTPDGDDGEWLAHIVASGFTPNSRVDVHGSSGPSYPETTDDDGGLDIRSPRHTEWKDWGVRLIDEVTGYSATAGHA